MGREAMHAFDANKPTVLTTVVPVHYEAVHADLSSRIERGELVRTWV